MHTNNNTATDDDLYDVVFASSSYLYTFGKFSRRRNWQISVNSTSTLLGLRRAASSRWLGWICQTRARTSAGQWQVPRILSDVNRAVWLCSLADVTIHFTSTNCVCAMWQCNARAKTHDVVWRCTQCERRFTLIPMQPPASCKSVVNCRLQVTVVRFNFYRICE